MKFIKHSIDEGNMYKYELHIEKFEADSLQLDKWDRHLLNECEGSSEISDALLALEMVTRRIEEQTKEDK